MFAALLLAPAGIAAQVRPAQVEPSQVVRGVSDKNPEVVLGAVLTIAADADEAYENPSVVKSLAVLAVGSDLPLADASARALQAIGPAAGEHLPVEFWSWEPQRSDRERVEAWFEIVAATRPDASVAVDPMFRIGGELLRRRDTPDVLLRAFAGLSGDRDRVVRSKFDRLAGPHDRAAALHVISTLPEGAHTFSVDEAHQLLDRSPVGSERFYLLHLIAARTPMEPAEIARLGATLQKYDYRDQVLYSFVASTGGAAGALLCTVPELNATRVREILEATAYHPSMACAVVHLGESTCPEDVPFTYSIGSAREVEPQYDPTNSAAALARMGEPGFAMLIRWFLEPFRTVASDVARKRQTAAIRALARHPRVPWPIFERLHEKTRLERTESEVRLMARFGAKASPDLRAWAEAGDVRAMAELRRDDADILLAAATDPEHPAHDAALSRAAELQLQPERIVGFLVAAADAKDWSKLLREVCVDTCVRALADLSVASDDKTRRNALRALGGVLSGTSDLSDSTRRAVTHAVRANWENQWREAQIVASRLGRGAAQLVDLLLESLASRRSESVAKALILSGVARRHTAQILAMSKRDKLARGPVRVLAATLTAADEDVLLWLREQMNSSDFTIRELAAEAVARHSTSSREILRARGLSWYGM